MDNDQGMGMAAGERTDGLLPQDRPLVGAGARGAGLEFDHVFGIGMSALRCRIATVGRALVVAILLGGILFAFQWKYGYNVGDEGWLWYISQNIHAGVMPIRDVFAYDPGRYLWSAAWFKIIGVDGLFEQRLANAIFGILGLACAYASMQSAGINAGLRLTVAILLALALCFPLHKVYEQSLSLMAVALVASVLRHSSDRRYWFALGIATGVAACIGRNSGLFYAVASAAALAATWRLLAFQKSSRMAIAYAIGVVLGYLPMILWFVFDPHFRRAMIDSVLFITKQELPLPIPFPWIVKQDFSSISAMHATMVSWLVVLVIGLYLAHALRILKVIAARQAMTPLDALESAALFVGIPYLYQGFDRADFAHIAQGILPLFLLTCVRLADRNKIFDRLAAGLFLVVAIVAWLPVEPVFQSWLAHRQDPMSTVNFNIDGRTFVLSRSTAMLLDGSRQVAVACHVKDGQLVAMPYFPGLLAYLHLRSPYWEMYYLYPRDEAFQVREIQRMKSYGTKVAVVDWSAALDGRSNMRFEALNPLLAAFIKTHFHKLDNIAGAPSNVNFMVRNCPG